MKWLSLALLIVLAYACSMQSEIPKNTVGWDMLQNARRIIYVGPNGNDQATGSRRAPLASIQRAIDIAQRGDVVKVEPGTYNENINLKSRVSLIGSGADLTILIADDGKVITAQNVFDVTIEGFTLDGRDSAQHALYADCEQLRRYLPTGGGQSPTMIALRWNVIKNFASIGVYGQYTNITLENNTFLSIAGNTIHLFRAFSKMANNNISLTDTGIYVQDGGSTIEGNVIQDAHGNGILCHWLTWAKIRRNKIVGAGRHGIKCEYGTPIIRSNYVSASAMSGVYCLGAEGIPSSPKIRANIITDNQSHGVHIGPSSWPDMGRRDDTGKNSIYDNGKCDVYSESARTIMAVGNWWGSTPPRPEQFYGNVDYGMALEEQPTYR